MIYTTYFGNLKNLPKNIIPISICYKAPDWWNGLQYRKLAPKYEFFKVWKETKDNDYYIEHFNSEVLGVLDHPTTVIMELKHLCDKSVYDKVDIALVCYEKPTDFCHRHLVAKWLRSGGYECKEYEVKKYDK